MNDDKKQIMDDQYHILHMNRGIERLEKLGTTRVYPKGYIFDYREKHPDTIFYIKKGRVIAYEDSYDGDHRIYNVTSTFAFIASRIGAVSADGDALQILPTIVPFLLICAEAT